MIFRERYSGKWVVLFFSLLLVMPSLFLKGCGGGGYTENPQAEVKVLVSPETVHDWVTNGYGPDEYGYTKMVILDVSPRTQYLGNPGHVPGAYLLETTYISGGTTIRSDGVADIPNMHQTRAGFDQLLRDMGIDEKTVVVFTGANVRMPQFGYYIFRYWGFPRNRLKVMNGSTYTYKSLGFELETKVPPAPAPSTYSVCQLQQNISFRAPLSEMITVAEDNDPKTVIVDARQPYEYNGEVPPPDTSPNNPGGPPAGRDGLIIPKPPAPTTPEYVAFEGHIRTAVNIPYNSLLEDYQLGELSINPYLPREDLIAMLNANGIDSSTIVYIYDTFSWKSSVLFLLLDELGWPAKIYDGSWGEWGLMAGESGKDGPLTANSPWRTDTSGRSVVVYYNKDKERTVYKPTNVNSYALRADMINLTDASACAGGGGGGGGIAPGY